jgi:uncharacterized membrane protein YgcG
MDDLTDGEVEVVLSGAEPIGASAGRAAAALSEIRRALQTEPDPEVAARHLAAMVAAAGVPPESRRAQVAGARSLVTRRASRRRTAGLALAAALFLGVGIAAAVTLPDQAPERARTVVPGESNPPEGVLPEASAHGQAVSEVARDPSLTGCEKGMAVSKVASAPAADHRQDGAERPDPCTQAERETPQAGSGGESGSARGSGSGGGSGGDGSGEGGSARGSSSGGGSGGDGSGEDGSARGSGGGSGSGGIPIELPTPPELPTN